MEMQANINSALSLLDSLTPNELRLLRSEVDARIATRESGDRSLLWEALVVELKSLGVDATPNHLPASLRRLIKQGEKAFLVVFAQYARPVARNEQFFLYRIVVAQAARHIKHSPRPLTAKTICQVLGEPGGGPASLLDEAFPGYGAKVPSMLFQLQDSNHDDNGRTL